MFESILNLALGLGIFLFGMQQLEKSLQQLGSEKIKVWLGRATQHSLSSVASGTFITAILQSSSMVSLLVLAFASAGLIPLFNAVGVILGANLGTTFTGWVVTTIGFKMDLEALALPLFGLGALGKVFAEAHTRRHALFGVLLGFGLLVLGLDQMKSAVADLPDVISPDFLAELNAPMFLLLGMGLTALIQSSSAMMLIALTALNGGLIDLTSAAALVVGADIGTTSTTALGSLKSPPIAKRLALAHVIYNLSVDTFAFVVLLPLLPLGMQWLGIEDPLWALVTFHSAFNLIGLIIFVPILKPFSRWLSTFFNHAPLQGATLKNIPPKVPEAAVIALFKEAERLLLKVLSLNLRNLKFDQETLALDAAQEEILKGQFPADQDFSQRYQSIKSMEGEIHAYISQIELKDKSEVLAPLVIELTTACRQAVYASKALKDARPGLLEFRHPKSDHEGHILFSEALKELYEGLLADLLNIESSPVFDKKEMRQLNELQHQSLHQAILLAFEKTDIDASGLSSMLNTNREIWSSNASMIEALSHLLLAYERLKPMFQKGMGLRSS